MRTVYQRRGAGRRARERWWREEAEVERAEHERQQAPHFGGDGPRFVLSCRAMLSALLGGGRAPMCKESVSTAGFTLGCQHFAGSVPRGTGF